MKPVLLCMIDKINSKKLDGFNKVYLNDKDYDYTNIGLGEKLSLKKDISSNKKIEDIVILAKNNNLNIHIIGDINKNKDNLKAILNMCKENNVYMHLFSNKKPSVKTLKKDLKVGKILNTIHDKLLETDIDRVCNIILDGKDAKNITISENDIIIFFNDDIGFISNFIDIVINKEYKNILTIYPYKNISSMYDINKKCLSDSLDELGIKVLENNNISYILDGYQRKNYKNIKYTYDIFNEKLSNYDLVITKISKEDLDKLNDMNLIIVSKENNKPILLTKNIDIKVNDIDEVGKAIIDLLKIKDNKTGVIFRIASVLFIIFCIVYYMTRLLHFYIME